MKSFTGSHACEEAIAYVNNHTSKSPKITVRIYEQVLDLPKGLPECASGFVGHMVKIKEENDELRWILEGLQK